MSAFNFGSWSHKNRTHLTASYFCYVPHLNPIRTCTYEGKIGVAIGTTGKLVDKFDAVELVKEAAEILGGKGGGGRKDFAQAGGINKDKIEDAFISLKKKLIKILF